MTTTQTDQVPEDLLQAAREAWANAYAPYSSFQVGAALRTKDGTVHAGANVENGSFGLSRCAEQSAVQAMASSGERVIGEVVVFTEASPPASPCGACRQILSEFGKDARVWLVNSQAEVIETSVRELLPLGFDFEESVG